MTLLLTCALLVLSALASPTTGSKSYCINLTSGQTSALPRNNRQVRWTRRPTANAGRCQLQGVIQITPPRGAKTVNFHITMENPTGNTFDIGDSETNDGFGGDAYTQKYDSEIHANDGTLGVYRSDVGGGAGYKLLYSLTHTVKKTMLIRVGKMELYMTNYDGSNLYTNDKSLFNLSKMYLGLNRVIHRYKSASVSQGRTGTGLCSVCIDFSSTAIEAVHKPY